MPIMPRYNVADFPFEISAQQWNHCVRTIIVLYHRRQRMTDLVLDVYKYPTSLCFTGYLIARPTSRASCAACFSGGPTKSCD